MIENLRTDAVGLLEKGDAKIILGFEKGSLPRTATPAFFTKKEDLERLHFDPFCFNNLARFARTPEILKHGKIGIVAKPSDVKALAVLVNETQLAEADLSVLMVNCDEMGGEARKCEYLGLKTLGDAMKLVEERFKAADLSADKLAALAVLDGKPVADRWRYWQEMFSRCVRCYACRQACPMCYCNRCIAEKNQPQWLPSSAHPLGNFMWNVVRAFHLAGRCIDCGECERACPVDLPLVTLNRFIAREIKNDFGFLAGYSLTEKPPMATYSEKDQENFIE
ncbi:MAG: 4Fe-4S dicluster domain-containing protein [Planctomycetota bacterium]|nr:4Fe-4S dicluster domain-containing protein [Planctomycetota bacterium]